MIIKLSAIWCRRYIHKQQFDLLNFNSVVIISFILSNLGNSKANSGIILYYSFRFNNIVYWVERNTYYIWKEIDSCWSGFLVLYKIMNNWLQCLVIINNDVDLECIVMVPHVLLSEAITLVQLLCKWGQVDFTSFIVWHGCSTQWLFFQGIAVADKKKKLSQHCVNFSSFSWWWAGRRLW